MSIKINEKIAALQPGATYFSLEFFPPKTADGLSNLHARLARMSNALRPLFVTVTWGASGTTSERSLELAEICQRQLGITTCLHLTCTNMSKRVLDAALHEARELGIRNILALRGDPPRLHEYAGEGVDLEGAEHFTWASDLVRYIRQEYGDYFCIGVAGYPEGHSDESHPESQDPRRDLPYLVEKVKAGADFIMTQLFYDEAAFLRYEELVRSYDNGFMRDVIIIPGLMPIQRFAILNRVTELSHAHLPTHIRDQLQPIQGDDEEVKRVGVRILKSMIDRIKAAPSPHRRGFHFYTLNLEKAVSFVLEQCQLIPPLSPFDDGVAIIDGDDLINGHGSKKGRRASSPHNHITSDSRSTSSLEPPSRATSLAITHGVGSLGREATWDDYPNGRFGDARSPAFGEIDGYGPSIHLSPAAARAKWGSPTTRSDISNLFVRHLQGEVDRLPWSEGPLNPETQVIGSSLCRLANERGWWSIASQPAVDGVRSTDSVFGWGPKSGFVFQKAFVEFWIPSDDWHNVLRPILMREDVASQVSWYASPNPQQQKAMKLRAGANGVKDATAPSEEVANSKLDEGFEASAPDAVNSVTWGSFPGKEIVTPTIIEAISFRAWAEEAFRIWREWGRCYANTSPSRALIAECARDCILVNVIGHAYRDRDALWRLLLDE